MDKLYFADNIFVCELEKKAQLFTNKCINCQLQNLLQLKYLIITSITFVVKMNIKQMFLAFIQAIEVCFLKSLVRFLGVKGIYTQLRHDS